MRSLSTSLKTLSFTICAAAGTERRNKGDVRYGGHQKVIIAVCFTGSYCEEKDSSNHICVDYRKLNKVTIVDPKPIKTLEDLFQQLGKLKFFLKINLNKEYWQIPIAEEDVFKTTFVTPDGTYE